MKAWTYAEITKIAKKTVKTFIHVGALCVDPEMRKKHIEGAFGAYVLWDNLTGDTGDQQERDKEELIRLMRSLDTPETGGNHEQTTGSE